MDYGSHEINTFGCLCAYDREIEPYKSLALCTEHETVGPPFIPLLIWPSPKGTTQGVKQ